MPKIWSIARATPCAACGLARRSSSVTGMGLDPNSVAEYLDNVMPPDAVGDFERICLESDVHLAEAAACHHVLTMILGQPADIDPIARQRMYTIATEAGERKSLRIEPAHKPAAAAAAVAVSSAGPAARSQPRSRSTEIPEYLQTGPWWRSWPAMAGLAALVIIGIGILIGSGVGGWFKGDSSLAELTPNTAAPAVDNESPAAPPAVDRLQSHPQNETAAPAAAPASTAATSPSNDSPPPPLTPAIEQTTPQAPATTKASVPDRYAVTAPAGENATATTQPPAVAALVPKAELPPAGVATTNPPAPANPIPPAVNGTGPVDERPAGNATAGNPTAGNVTANVPANGGRSCPTRRQFHRN